MRGGFSLCTLAENAQSENNDEFPRLSLEFVAVTQEDSCVIWTALGAIAEAMQRGDLRKDLLRLLRSWLCGQFLFVFFVILAYQI